MSDAMSNREIEDVLSSIRRLVARESERPAQGERLVLTEAQRVAVNNAQPPVARAETGDSAGTVGVDSEVPVGDERARLQAAIAGLDRTRGSAAGDAQGAPLDHADARLPSAAAGFASPSPHAASALGGVSGREAVQPGASASESDAAGGTGAATGTDYGEAEEWNGPSWTARGDMAAAGAGEDDEAETLGEESARPGAGHDASDADMPDDAEPAETLIDEEMLRALVAQLVREELRGQLGERITMQVRKLVRAEIARALDEREYL